jgi:acetyl-CoA acetyltransferase
MEGATDRLTRSQTNISPRVGDVFSGAACGAIGAMAMTGMRVITTELGLVEQTPPQAVSRQQARGMRALLRRASSVAG